MNKSLILLFIAITAASTLSAQQVMNIANFQPELNYENVHVYELDNDPLTTTFIIWVKDEVKKHFHEDHTEIVYVLEGEGEMILRDEKRIIRPGDYIFIPRRTHHEVKVTSDEPMKVLSVQTPQFDGSDRVFPGEY